MNKIPYTYVKGHYIHRFGKRIYVKPHKRKIKGAMLKTTRGEKFRKLKKRIKLEYINKGYSEKEAERIATATAGKIFWLKFGKSKGKKILKREH